MATPAKQNIRSRPPGLFDHDMRFADLSRRGDILHRFDQVPDWDRFVRPIEQAFAKAVVAPGARHARLPVDKVMISTYPGPPAKPATDPRGMR